MSKNSPLEQKQSLPMSFRFGIVLTHLYAPDQLKTSVL